MFFKAHLIFFGISLLFVVSQFRSVQCEEVNPKLSAIENEIVSFLHEIISTKQSWKQGDPNVTHEARNQFKKLETKYENVSKSLSDEIDVLSRILDGLKTFKSKLESEIEECRSLVNPIFGIRDTIKLHDYGSADRKILAMNQPKLIDSILEVVNFDFDLMNDYAQNTGHADISFNISSLLWNEMNSIGHQDVIKLCKLYKNFQKIVESKNASLVMKSKAVIGFEQIEKRIISLTVEQWQLPIFNASTKNEELIQKIADEIYDTNKNIFDEIIRKLVDVSESKSEEQLVSAMFAFESTSQKAAALLQLFPKIIIIRALNDSTVFSLVAESVMKLRALPDYAVISQNQRNEIQKVTEILPNSIRNLYFSEMICLENVQSHSILYSPNPINPHARYVACRRSKHPKVPFGAKWRSRPVPEGDNRFKFENFKYKNEFLSVAKANQTRLNLFSCSGNKCSNDNHLWQTQFNANGVSLINVQFNLYLCIAYGTIVEMRISKGHTNECHWVLQKC